MRLQDIIAKINEFGDSFMPGLWNTGRAVNELGNRTAYLQNRLFKPTYQALGLLNNPDVNKQYDQQGADYYNRAQALTNELDQKMGGDYSKIQQGELMPMVKQVALTGGRAGLEVAPFASGAAIYNQPLKQALPTLAKEGTMYGAGLGALNTGQAYNEGERDISNLAMQFGAGMATGLGGEALGYGVGRGITRIKPAILKQLKKTYPGFTKMPSSPRVPKGWEQLDDGTYRNIKTGKVINTPREIEAMQAGKANMSQKDLLEFDNNPYKEGTIAYHGISNTKYSDDGALLGLGNPYMTLDDAIAQRYADDGAVADYLFKKTVPLNKQYVVSNSLTDTTFKDVTKWLKGKGEKNLDPDTIFKHYMDYVKSKGKDMITGEAYEPYAGFVVDPKYLK